MYRSRLNKYEERKEKRQIFGAIIGSIALFAFLAIFGVKILVGFSLLVDKLRGAPPKQEQEQTYLLPPTIDPVEEATNSASFSVSGRSGQKRTVLVYGESTSTEVDFICETVKKVCIIWKQEPEAMRF